MSKKKNKWVVCITNNLSNPYECELYVYCLPIILYLSVFTFFDVIFQNKSFYMHYTF